MNVENEDIIKNKDKKIRKDEKKKYMYEDNSEGNMDLGGNEVLKKEKGSIKKMIWNEKIGDKERKREI